MKLHKIILGFVVLFSVSLHAQRAYDPTPEDIARAKNLKKEYKDDDIAIINSRIDINFSYDRSLKQIVVQEDVEEKLMNIGDKTDIFKYYTYDDQSIISLFNIYYRNGKKTQYRIYDEAYNSNGIFHMDARVKYTKLVFPLKGYSYKTKVKIKTYDIKYFTQIFFMDKYPVLNKTVRIKVPNWLDVEFKEINFDSYKIHKKVIKNKKDKIIEYTIKKVPAGFNEKKSPGPTYIYPHLLVLAKSYTIKGNKKTLFKETKDLYAWYRSLTKRLKNNNKELKKKVTSLTAKAKTDEEKIKNIFYWVQDNIRYIAFEDGIAGFKPEEAENVFKKRYGDCKGMANLTKQMLKEAGFDARLTWIGTKRIAYDYTTPSLSVDNHMICTLFKDKDTLFLDATEKYNPLGEYAYRIQGKQALIENGDNFILKKVPEMPITANKEIIHYELKLDNENLTGKASQRYEGEMRTGILYAINNLKKDKKDEALQYFLSQDDANFKVSDIKVSDIEDRESALQMDYAISIKNAVSSYDNETYIGLELDKYFSDFDFKKRKTAYVFSNKKNIEIVVELEVPTPYKIQYLPKGISVKTDEFDMSVNYTKKANKIIYTKKFIISQAKVSPKNFDKWNEFNKKLVEIYNDQIVLIK